jgi:DNA adenine methylase
MPKSVLKWAGGKTSVLNEIGKRFDNIEGIENRTLFDVFSGGGSIAFEFHESFGHVVMNDVNPELLNVYHVLKKNPNKLYKLLLTMKDKHSHDFYYEVRSWDRKDDFAERSLIERAARTIYLNKTCYNGLYRVNQDGKFNVPLGRQQTVSIVDENIFFGIHNKLKSIDIMNKDYRDILSLCQPGDVVYIDPPYDKINDTSFVAYTEKPFTREDQVRLKNEVDRLTEIGVYVVASNAMTPFIRNLYSKYLDDDSEIGVRRNIAANTKSREPISEMLIDNIRQVNQDVSKDQEGRLHRDISTGK